MSDTENLDLDELDTVHQQQADAVTLADTVAMQPGRDTFYRRPQL